LSVARTKEPKGKREELLKEYSRRSEVRKPRQRFAND
jgi:hypothetical protein